MWVEAEEYIIFHAKKLGLTFFDFLKTPPIIHYLLLNINLSKIDLKAILLLNSKIEMK